MDLFWQFIIAGGHS